MGEDSYSVTALHRYIVRRFNTTGFQREEIEFDIYRTITGSYSFDDRNYEAMIENGIEVDFEELRNRAKQAADPVSSIPAELLVKRVDGRRFDNMDNNLKVFRTFPLSVDYDTGELFYL